jgi:hypothetical protein
MHGWGDNPGPGPQPTESYDRHCEKKATQQSAAKELRERLPLKEAANTRLAETVVVQGGDRPVVESFDLSDGDDHGPVAKDPSFSEDSSQAHAHQCQGH